MKTKQLILIAFLIQGITVSAQDCPPVPQPIWQVGIGLGELPIGGSFKPSLTFGAHVSKNLYFGVIYQFKDEIRRDGSSFNAKSAKLDGLVRSHEVVDQRFMFQARYTFFKNGPYFSTGFVFNGKDVENMSFDSRERAIAGENYTGTVEISQTRPAGWGFALMGLGYQYTHSSGFALNFEWTPAIGAMPEPEYEFSGTSDLSDLSKAELKTRLTEGFNNSVTNRYKVFHVGLAYKIPHKS